MRRLDIPSLSLPLIVLIFALPAVFQFEFWPLSAYRMYMWRHPLEDLKVFRLCYRNRDGTIVEVPSTQYDTGLFSENLLLALLREDVERVQELKRYPDQDSSLRARYPKADFQACIKTREFSPESQRVETIEFL